MQELGFQFPAFKDVIRLTPKEEDYAPVFPVKIRTATIRNFKPETKIPLGWFKHEEYREQLVKLATATVSKELPIQLVFNTTPVTRHIQLFNDKQVLIEERFSQPEIPIWTSLGGWFASRADESFTGPGWKYIFVRL